MVRFHAFDPSSWPVAFLSNYNGQRDELSLPSQDDQVTPYPLDWVHIDIITITILMQLWICSAPYVVMLENAVGGMGD